MKTCVKNVHLQKQNFCVFRALYRVFLSSVPTKTEIKYTIKLLK